MGCLSQKEVAPTRKKALPAWYTNPLQTTHETLYATGEGQSKEDAISNALSMMASTLSVSIASQFSSKTTVKEGTQNSIDSTVSNKVQSDVKKIRLSHYEILKSQEFGFKKHIVLIKSEKKKLFESLKNELDQRFAMIESDIKISQKQSALEELRSYKKAKEQMQDIPDILTVMNVLNTAFDTAEYVEKINVVQSGYAALIASTSINIVLDSESKNLEAHIREALSAKKIQIKNGSGDRHFTIMIASDIQRAYSYGFIVLRSAIEITLKDSKGAILGSKKLNITSQSAQSYEIAKEGIAIKFGELVKKEGIEKIVGLEL